MAALPTISQAILTGKLTTCLMGNDYAMGTLFGARLIKRDSAVMVALVTDALDWQNQGNPTDATLQGVANYLIWLCGKYPSTAIIGSGGGTVIPTPPSATSPNMMDFFVTASTLIPTGGNTVTILSYIGYNLQFNRGSIPQGIIPNGGTYFSWNKVTGVFTCYPSANLGEEFILIPYV